MKHLIDSYITKYLVSFCFIIPYLLLLCSVERPSPNIRGRGMQQRAPQNGKGPRPSGQRGGPSPAQKGGAPRAGGSAGQKKKEGAEVS